MQFLPSRQVGDLFLVDAVGGDEGQDAGIKLSLDLLQVFEDRALPKLDDNQAREGGLLNDLTSLDLVVEIEVAFSALGHDEHAKRLLLQVFVLVVVDYGD